MLNDVTIMRNPGSSREYTVINDYQFQWNKVTYCIPQGFLFDGASVPRLLWSWHHPFDPRIIDGAVRHDFAYWTHCMTKANADMMLTHGSDLNKLDRWAYRMAVKAFGNIIAWGFDKEDKKYANRFLTQIKSDRPGWWEEWGWQFVEICQAVNLEP